MRFKDKFSIFLREKKTKKFLALKGLTNKVLRIKYGIIIVHHDWEGYMFPQRTDQQNKSGWTGSFSFNLRLLERNKTIGTRPATGY